MVINLKLIVKTIFIKENSMQKKTANLTFLKLEYIFLKGRHVINVALIAKFSNEQKFVPDEQTENNLKLIVSSSTSSCYILGRKLKSKAFLCSENKEK